jgi:hypothetical protein
MPTTHAGTSTATTTARPLTLSAGAVADATAPALAPPGRTWTLPHGRVIERVPRGIYWSPCMVGAAFLCYLVDSTGDGRGIWRTVAATAPAEEFDRTEAELHDLLDWMDPIPGPTLLR